MPNHSLDPVLQLSVQPEIYKSLNPSFAINYGLESSQADADQANHVAIRSLLSRPFHETWSLRNGQRHDVKGWHIFQNDEYLMAAVPGVDLNTLNLEQAAEKCYSMIFQQMEKWSYPYLVRTWNYFADITEGHPGHHNNYQLFCSGRARAYQKHNLIAQPYPAATVIGSRFGGLTVYFIAAKSGGIGIENPRQVSAFRYPSIYSQDPPLFSRAFLHRNYNQEVLFISGTASITGHHTRHEDDVISQTGVCLENIQHLLNTASTEYAFPETTFSELKQLKIYLKHDQQLDAVKTHIEHEMDISAPVIYLQGDMCRSDLLVEIEALAIHPAL